MSSLIKEGTENINYYTSVTRAICYNIFCSESSLTIQIHDDYILCPRAGGKIVVDGYQGFFLCPDYNLMCSGTVICNDLFDWVDKQSEVKESSYIYDYEIKTSQNLEDAEINEADSINNYELSENGICSIYCKQCKRNNKCIKCKNDYGLVGYSDSEKIECLDNSKLSVGYYKLDNDVHYQCMNNFEICLDDLTCEKCNDLYDYYENKCILRIENCKEYDEDGICSKCNEKYAFDQEKRDECINLEHFNVYYTPDNGISYYPCDEKINNCKKCHYNQLISNPVCSLCKEDFVLINEEKICYSKQFIEENKNYYYLDDTHAKKCSEEIVNSEKCFK